MVFANARRYVIFFAAFMFQFLTIGMSISLSVLYVELVNVFNSERWKASLIQGLFFGLTVASGFLWTMVISKIGIGCSIALGVLLATAGLLGSAFAGSISTIVVLTGVFGGIGYSVCYLGSYMSVNYAFKDAPEVPTTVLSVGSAIGQIILPLFLELILERYGWSGALMLMAGMTLQSLPCAVIIHVLLESGGTTHKETKHFVCDQQLIRNIPFWILIVNMFLLPMAETPELFFIVDQVVDIGYTRSDGAVILIALGCANMCGRISGSLIKIKWKTYPTVYHWIYLFLLLVVCHVLVVKLASYNGLLAACILHGLTFGTLFSLIATVTYDTVGKKRYAAALVVVNTAFGFGIVFNEVIGGLIRDNLGRYDVDYYIAIGMCLLCNVGNVVISVFITLDFRRKAMETYLLSSKSDANYSTME